MKRVIAAVLSLLLISSTLGVAEAAVTTTATSTSSAIYVNGSIVAFQAYTIDGNNYFKLRDIAMALNGTGKQFSVGYDNTTGIILLTSGKTYIPIGGELTFRGSTGTLSATTSTSRVYLDGSPVDLKAYIIDGYNYFKLRDLGSAIDFGVGWNGTANSIAIDTTIGYSPDASSVPAGVTADTGFFDSSMNYSAQKHYKIAYLYSGSSVLYDMLSRPMAKWARRLNCSYNDFSSLGDVDTYINTIETYATQGYDGLILDPDYAIYPRCADLLAEVRIPWMSCIAAPYDKNGKTLLHPAIVYDDEKFGADAAQANCDWAKKNWPDAGAAQVGAIFIGYSVVPLLQQRAQGYRDAFIRNYPDSGANYFFCDGVSGMLNLETGYNLTSAVLAMNPKIKYWLIGSFFDDYTNGASRAAEAAGKDSTTVCSGIGGSSLIERWDAGGDGCWKSAVFTDVALQTEPVICGLYAMMSGKATAETLWPKWVNKSAGDRYATIQPATFVLTKDNYKEYLECVDAYTGFNAYNYPYRGTQFPLRATPPASYGG